MVVMVRCIVGMPTGYDSISSPSNSLCTPICVRAAYGVSADVGAVWCTIVSSEAESRLEACTAPMWTTPTDFEAA